MAHDLGILHDLGGPFILQAYFMLDEMLLAGELQEPSKKAVTRVIEVQVRRRVKGNSCACQTPQTLRLSCAPRHTL